MAVQTLQTPQTALTRFVQRWDRRWRWTQTLRWLPAALMPGLAAGIVLALTARLAPIATTQQIGMAALLLMAAGVAVMASIIWLRDRSLLHAARRLDLMLGLNERLSTALELSEGRISTRADIAALQADDARERAYAAQPTRAIPFRTPVRGLLIVIGLGVALAILLTLPNSFDAQVAADAARQAAIEEAAETIRQITRDVAADPVLSDEERNALIETLDTTANVLSQSDVSPEEAFAAVSDAENALRGLEQEFNQQTRASQNAAAMAAAALQAQPPPQTGQTDSLSQLTQALEQLASDAQSASGTMLQQMQQQLGQAASALQQSGSQSLQQAGAQLQQAAQQMQAGDTAGAQERMEQAQQQIEQAEQERQQAEDAAERSGQQAEQAQQAASQISEAQSQQSEQSDEQSEGQQQGQSQQQGQGQSEQAQEGSQSQQQQGQGEQSGQQSQSGGSSQSQQQSQSSQAGQSGGEQAQQQGQEGQSSQAGQQAAQGSQGESSGQLSATGMADAGAGSGDGQSEGAQVSGSGQTDQGNRPDGQGEREYESIYAPQRLGGENSDSEIFLQSDDPNAPVIEGDYAANPTGQTQVPYSQVFASYREAASQALENAYVPLGLRDVIRSYFTSLDPSTGP